jgi:superfamily I DNA/RNA helicase
VDEPDFQKIHNGWNYKYGKLESRIKEKNQLRYVAYTRAKTNLYIVYDEVLQQEDNYNYENDE